jgi:uncharacterized protein (TIGR00299 family) protein
MKVLYLDAFSGISGDMTVGALLALGMPLEHLRAELAKLALAGYAISAEPRLVHGIEATKFDVTVEAAGSQKPSRKRHARDHGHAHHHGHVHVSHGHAHRAYRDIRAMIETSALKAGIKERAVAIFAKLAAAEGKVHALAPDDVQFHEVGAVDSIVDIVGTAIGLEFFAPERILVSALPLGAGVVNSEHGPIPVPGPATAELLRGFSSRLGDGEGEMVTPTGAAIVAALAEQQAMPELRIEGVGYGAGQRSLRDRPNVLRLILGETAARAERDEIVVIETNIDDYNPELYEYVVERLIKAGARDVYLTAVQMKKGRPGVILSVLCAADQREALGGIVLAETSAIGLRYYSAQRMVLERDVRQVVTDYGTVRVKVARGPDGHENLAPEYEDCKRIAAERQVPIKLVYQAALVAAADARRR